MKRIWGNGIFFLCGLSIGIIYMIYRCGYLLDSKQKMSDKYFSYFNLLEQWLECSQKGYKLSDYFYCHNLSSAVIYGMGKMGKRLKYELEKDGIAICYVIDEGENVFYEEADHCNLRDKLPFVDLVIVTPIAEFDEIKDRILNNNQELKVISLKELVSTVKAMHTGEDNRNV